MAQKMDGTFAAVVLMVGEMMRADWMEHKALNICPRRGLHNVLDGLAKRLKSRYPEFEPRNTYHMSIRDRFERTFAEITCL